VTARSTSRRRAEAALLRRDAEAAGTLPGFEPPTVRAILESEATRPLRGGAEALPPGGMFAPPAPEQGRLL
jgi:hypothetical protein